MCPAWPGCWTSPSAPSTPTSTWTASEGYAADSGEGRWTVEAAIDHAVPLPTITASLYARFASRQDDSKQMKMVAALRNQFGGHPLRSRDR
jgi:6-phosphogluconate dehydrogenase